MLQQNNLPLNLLSLLSVVARIVYWYIRAVERVERFGVCLNKSGDRR
jgi:hypothetical protein